MVRWFHLVGALALGACFSGRFLEGQPCSGDRDCGTELSCKDGFCGTAPVGQSSSGSTPTTSASASGTGVASTTTTTTTTDETGTSAGVTAEAVDSSTSSTSTTSTTSEVVSTGLASSGTTGETCGIGRCKDVDLLFVYDDSPSMGPKIQAIITAMLAFQIVVFPELKNLCSLHIGVVTTDQVYPFNPPECQQLGALTSVNQQGVECSFAEGHPYATLADLDDPTVFACGFDVGSKGETDERPVDAMFATITDKELNSGCNDGFYRPDALLVLGLAIDEDDDDNDAQGHSGSKKGMASLWGPLFQALKSNGVEDMYVFALLGDEDPNATMCPWDPLAGADGLGAESAPNLRKFVNSFPPERQAVASICNEPDVDTYLPFAQQVLTEMVAACAI